MKLSRAVLFLSGIASSVALAAPQEISLWRHQASDAEVQSSLSAISRFNSSQDTWKVVPDLIPEHSYTQAIMAAAQAEVLPCIIDIDQPLVPNFAWNGYLTPLDELLDQNLLDSFIPSAKGTYGNHVYSLGLFDVALALFTRVSLLQRIDVRYPTIDQPWTKDEFMDVLDKIKALGEYDYPFDMRAFDKTEWIPYAWSSFMISWGADLISRDNYLVANGILNSNEAVEFGKWIQLLAEQDYVNENAKSDVDLAGNQVAIQFSGSWLLDRYYSVLGDDLAVLPVPDFGNGPVIGGGSWHWAVSNTCPHLEAAKEFLSFISAPDQIVRQGDITPAFPTTVEAAKLTKNFSETGKWRIVYDFSTRFAKLRPETPAYAAISVAYRTAMEDILSGIEPKAALDIAVEKIESAAKKYSKD